MEEKTKKYGIVHQKRLFGLSDEILPKKAKEIVNTKQEEK